MLFVFLFFFPLSVFYFIPLFLFSLLFSYFFFFLSAFCFYVLLCFFFLSPLPSPHSPHFYFYFLLFSWLISCLFRIGGLLTYLFIVNMNRNSIGGHTDAQLEVKSAWQKFPCGRGRKFLSTEGKGRALCGLRVISVLYSRVIAAETATTAGNAGRPRLRARACVCVCVCVFIKLHITAQSGPVILVILCHSHWSSQGGDQ